MGRVLHGQSILAQSMCGRRRHCKQAIRRARRIRQVRKSRRVEMARTRNEISNRSQGFQLRAIAHVDPVQERSGDQTITTQKT